jgi:glycosyltransferase involved in cell wall biosynthesis
MDLISIVMPTYKRSDMIGRAIESILNQTYRNFEIIIVDDNDETSIERQETEENMKPYISNKKIKYIKHKKNFGGSQARNTGIRITSGKYITFLDDDDEYYPEKLEKQYAFYKDNFPCDEGFINSQIDVYQNGKYWRRTKTKVDYEDLLFSAVSEKILGTPTLFIPKRQLLEVGGFPEIPKGQEWYLSIKLIESGLKFKSMPDRLVRVNIHNKGSIFDGHSSFDKRVDGLKNIYRIQKSYFGLFNDKQIKLINFSHNMALANAYLIKDTTESINYLKIALKYKLIDVVVMKYIIKLTLRVTKKSKN